METSRRNLLGAMAVMPALGIAFNPALSTTLNHAALFSEMDRIDAETRRLNALPYRGHESEWEAKEKWEDRIYLHIDALPNTPENAKLKARCVMSIVEGDVTLINEGQSTVCRMVQHVISALNQEGV